MKRANTEISADSSSSSDSNADLQQPAKRPRIDDGDAQMLDESERKLDESQPASASSNGAAASAASSAAAPGIPPMQAAQEAAQPDEEVQYLLVSLPPLEEAFLKKRNTCQISGLDSDKPRFVFDEQFVFEGNYTQEPGTVLMFEQKERAAPPPGAASNR